MFLTFISFNLSSKDEPTIPKYLVEGTLNFGIDANETFSISGSVISTVDLSSNLTKVIKNSQSTRSGDGVILTESENTNTSISDELNPLNQIIDDSSSISSSIGLNQQPSFSMESNQTDDLSNNLVSMLSGIIIQSIEKGNPTINSLNLSDPLQLKSENISIILAGNWQMSVLNSNITDFDVRFVMITSNGTGFHWHSMNGLKSDTKVYFGSDENIYLIGTVDFFTENKLVSKEVKIAIMINNLETIQIIFLDDQVANHLYNHPLYGTIDKIEIPN
ncbi:MAG TPA: hypothetical protein VJR94_03220 [Candidatus Nitrosocosmicus sp.]|nr:hypothetical protein [Candidatus Nitrosocosmicus sp.]